MVLCSETISRKETTVSEEKPSSLSHTNFNMSDINVAIQDAVNKYNGRLSLCKMDITDDILTTINGIWMNCKTITSINLSCNKITTMKNIVFPPCVERLFLDNNQIATLDGFVIPDSLEYLELVFFI